MRRTTAISHLESLKKRIEENGHGIVYYPTWDDFDDLYIHTTKESGYFYSDLVEIVHEWAQEHGYVMGFVGSGPYIKLTPNI